MSQTERLNLIVVSSLAATLILLIVGTFAALFSHLPLPEFVNNISTLVAGGLLGYLGAHRSSAPSTGSQTDVTNADVVNVQSAPAVEPPGGG